MSNCPTRFELVSWKTGDLNKDEAQKLRNHTDQCENCSNVLRQLSANMSEYETKGDFYHHRLMEQVERELEKDRRVRPRIGIGRWVPAVSLGALALIIAGLVLILGTPEKKSEEAVPAFSIKGSISLEVFAKRDTKPFRVKPHAELMQGDALRFVLTTDSSGFAAVFSVDGKGKLSSFYPDSQKGKDATPIRVGAAGRFEFPGSIILDDVLGPETYAVVFSKKKFALKSFYDLFLKNSRDNTGDYLKKRYLKHGFQVETLRIKKIQKKN